MPIAVGFAAFALVTAVLVVFVVITSYNTVVALDRRADRAWANVDVALKQRWDELPNLVAAVRGQLGFERTVLDEVTRLRAAYSPAAPLPEQAATSLATTVAVRSLFSVVERYPELHSNENVMALQLEIERLETVIAHRRELFNEQVYQYNATIAQLPAVLLAGIFGWRQRELFEIGAAERGRPEVGILPS
jgi:LemA protein